MSTKDSARLTMDSCVGREREDQAVKRLFSRKDFLANIMKGTIAEYADLSIEEIMDCIEGDTIQTGTALVSEDAANTIRRENPQFTAIGEAPAIMDLIFRSLVPSLDETIKINLHVDLEFQQDYAVPYPVEKRAFFYATRRISAQLPKVGKNGAGYKNLEKVYSIWICMENIPKYLQGSISYHKMVNYKNTGMTDGKNKENFLKKSQKDIDLVEIVIVRLGKNKEERGVLDFLQGVFSGDQEKVFSYLPDNTADEKEVVDMLTMVDCIEKRGEKRGERLGKQLSQARMQKLILSLAADNKSEDIIRIAKDDEYLEKMYKEYGI